MEKPVRILGNDKIRTFNEKVRSGLERALNFMLAMEDSAKIEIGVFDPFLMPINAYTDAYRKESILIKVHSERAFHGELYWFFELKTAISLGGMMRMMTPSALEEKMKANSFDAADQDSFGEVGNQLCGILDRAFRTITLKDIHLRMDFEKKVYPSEDIKSTTFIDNEEYVVLLSTISVPKYGKQKLTLLLPRTLFETLLNLEIQLEGITPKLVLIHSPNPELCEKLQSNINSRYAKAIFAKDPDDILNLIDQPGIAAVGIQLKSISSPISHPEAIYLKRLLANRTFMKLPSFVTWPNSTLTSLADVEKLGLKTAVAAPMDKGFLTWLQPHIQKP